MTTTKANLVAHVLFTFLNEKVPLQGLGGTDPQHFIVLKRQMQSICAEGGRKEMPDRDEHSIFALGNTELDPEYIRNRIAEFPPYQAFMLGAIFSIMCMPVNQVSIDWLINVLAHNNPTQVIGGFDSPLASSEEARKKLRLYLASNGVPGMWVLDGITESGDPIITTVFTPLDKGTPHVHLILNPAHLQAAGIRIETEKKYLKASLEVVNT